MARAFELLFVALAFGAVAPASRADLTVFRDGKVLMPVFVVKTATPDERAAAEELGRVLEKMSGLVWPVQPADEPVRPGIYVGAALRGPGAVEKLKLAQDPLAPKAGEIGPDGFRITSRDGSIFVEGATPGATRFAVSWLLQHEGGVRWYDPGKNGEQVPRRTKWVLPDLHEVREPAYFSREISGLRSADEKVWAQYNGLGGRLNYSHALSRVFSRGTIELHPNWAPQSAERRYGPVSADDQNWQPNLALPEVADYAAQQARAAFDRDPALESFSLGINDAVRFDQSAATRSRFHPLGYFRGRPDYSPLVFSFMNRAADSLALTHPDRTLGCLAYFWCENPPPFPVQRNVVPYVTSDRSQYYDQAYRAADLALMSRWEKSGVKAFGLWEYAYGRGFLIPKLPLSSLAESIREGWRRGARGYQGEVGPQWGFDTFKVWMLAQLLWEPDRSVEKLADDFYAGYYAAATGPMRRFAERCERQWMTQTGAPGWLKYYMQEDQMLLFPADACRELRGLLTEAKRAAGGDPVVRQRVERTSRAFAVTEAYQKFDGLRREATSFDISASEIVVAGAIRELVRTEETFLKKFKAAREGELPAMTTVDLPAFVRNDPIPRLLWLAGQTDPAAPRRILARAGPKAAARADWRMLADIFANGQLKTAPNLAANSSFALVAKNSLEPQFLYPGSGVLPAKWEISAMPTETGKVSLEETGADQRRRTLRIAGAWDTQVYQWIPAEPDCVYLATARLRGTAGPGNDSALFLTFLDERGKVVGPVRMQALPKGVTVDWRTLALADRTPEEAAWVGIGIGATRQQPGDTLEIAAVELRGVIGETTP